MCITSINQNTSGRGWEKVAAANIIQLESLVSRLFLIRGRISVLKIKMLLAKPGRRLNFLFKELRRERALRG